MSGTPASRAPVPLCCRRAARGPSSSAAAMAALPNLDADAMQVDDREAPYSICIGVLVAGEKTMQFRSIFKEIEIIN
jgi:hypothetical protein